MNAACRWLLGVAVICGLGAPDRVVDAQGTVVSLGPDVVWIEAGWFIRGSDDDDLRHALMLCRHQARTLGRKPLECDQLSPLFAAEAPATRIYLSRFGMDRTEVTRRRWDVCVRAGRCPPSRIPASDPRFGDPEMPVAGITWSEARQYCAFAGGHLPSEAQWERAARGSVPRRFPWGQQFNDRLANLAGALDGFRTLAPVGSFANARSPAGLLDAAGNVSEWTADAFSPDGYSSEERIDPAPNDSGGPRVVRGGSWRSEPYAARTAFRWPAPASSQGPDIGVRCAY